MWMRVEDYQMKKIYEESLFGKDSGLNIGSYQIESLGGRVTYLHEKVRIYSLESVQIDSSQ
jgi:hypothetical protein